MEINFKKDYKFWLLLLFSIILVLLLAFYDIKLNNLGYVANYSPFENEEEYTKEYEAQKVGDYISQSFVAKYDNLSKVYIKFADLILQNRILISSGTGRLGLKDENGNTIYEKMINSRELILNVDYEFDFSPIQNSKGKKYEVFFECSELETDSEFYKIIYSENTLLEDGELFINGEKVDGTIFFQDMYENFSNVLKIITYMLVIIVILSIITIYIYYHKNLTPEKLFWILIPAIFIMFMILMPAFKSHDEAFHWFKIQELSKGNFLVKVEDDKPIANLRKDIFDVTTLRPEGINYKYVINKIVNDETSKLETEKTSIPTAAVYSPIQHLPQTLGVVVARAIYDNAMFIAYIATLVNMMVAIFMLYLAIKKMPFGKTGLLISMLLPIAVEGFTSLSPDAITISTSYLFIAYVLDIVFNDSKKVNKIDIIIMFVLAVILALCKIVYLPIVGIIVLLGKNKFKDKKTSIIVILIILIVATFANLLWLKIANGYLELYKDGRSNLQLSILFQNPVKYLQKVLFSINYYIGDYTYSLFGNELGWNEFARINNLVPVVMAVLFLFVNISDNTLKIKLTKFQNIILGLIICAVVGLIFTSLYMQWNDSIDLAIKGIQGRYFIPLIPLIVLLVFPKIKLKSDLSQESILKISGITISIVYMYVLIKLLILNL